MEALLLEVSPYRPDPASPMLGEHRGAFVTRHEEPGGAGLQYG